ncbi:hypothetical protein [Oscillibacter sp.]|uniref:hypothetical protein n=1 Tax=Oscillibacter sp. TaxID=1945593 RepID=UPI002D80CE1E|nr:hypothetical protein [Oscillibacter sp.]
MLNRELALDEARKQKEALTKIGGWRRCLFLLAASLAAVAMFGFQTEGWLVLGVVAAIAGAVSLGLTFLVDLSIRNGRRNVERILESLR